ncbi:MAG: lipoyl(octanoyl) transferase LipB [Planctomycetota bacterium]
MRPEGRAQQTQADPMTGQPQLHVIGPQRMPYGEALRLQVRLRDACIAAGAERNCLLLVEHPPTITIGRAGNRADLLADEGQLAELGVEVVETNRGGEVTYHGPGQLVAYPILDLRQRGRDLHRYLRNLEAWLVKLCRGYGVPAHAASPHTGVWVEDRKIASIGIAVRRWVSYHGAALNVSTDLSHFDLIVPCGLRGVTVTSLERELGWAPPLEHVAERAAACFAECFGMQAERTNVHMAETR